MTKQKPKINKAINFLAITFPFLFLAPLFLNLGFKAIGRSQLTFGYILVAVGIVFGILALYFMVKGLKYMLDHLFEK